MTVSSTWAVIAVLALIGAVLALIMGLRSRGGFRPPRKHFQDPRLPLPNAALVRMEGSARLLSKWSFFAMLALELARDAVPDSLYRALLPALGLTMVSMACIGFAVAAYLRCTSCGKRMLLESIESPPFAPPRLQADNLRRGCLRCMFCGQGYHTH
jgi:hypothetical protein